MHQKLWYNKKKVYEKRDAIVWCYHFNKFLLLFLKSSLLTSCIAIIRTVFNENRLPHKSNKSSRLEKFF